jgi:hypothetical protein
MDCRDELEGYLNLCSEPECVNSTITFGVRDRKPHSPNHWMFKVYRFIFDRDMNAAKEDAWLALTLTDDPISRFTEWDEPACAHCKVTVSLPCWYCAQCTGKSNLSA